MKRSLIVFLCSTYSDLVDEREAVLDAIRRLQFQHDSMEFFGARTDLPIETCLHEVRKSDVLVVIVGYRYGTLVPDLGISFSEAEYNEGYRLGKPCLVYIRDEDVPILPRNMERDPNKLRLLERFCTTLAERHTVAKFRNAHSLAVQVTADLSRTVQAIEDSVRAEKESPSPTGSAVFEEIEHLVQDALDSGLRETSVLSAIRQSVASLLGSEGRRRPLVFLSHSHADKEIVRQVAQVLREADYDVWFDEEEIHWGARIVDEVQRGLDTADFMAFFISQNSMNSQWAKRELNAMMLRRLEQRGGAVVLPIRLDDAEVPALLRDVMYLDLRDGDVPKAVAKMLEAIEYHAARRRKGKANSERANEAA